VSSSKGIQEDGALAADQIETGLEAGEFGCGLAGGGEMQAERQNDRRRLRPHPGTDKARQPKHNSRKPTARVKKQPSVEGLMD
jgi:hypothetical protein